MNLREAKELIKHEIRSAGMKISHTDPKDIEELAKQLLKKLAAEPNEIFLETTPTGKIKYNLHSILPNETWRYIDVNAISIANFIRSHHFLNMTYEIVSPTEIIVTRYLY